MATTHAVRDYDLIDVEVHQKAMANIAREMAITLLRTSGSPVVTEAKDFSTCILDAAGEQLAFSGYVSFHVSTAMLGVQAVLRRFSAEQVRPGDAFCCNDPHSSGAVHQCDIGIVVPFFFRGQLIGWGYVNEHVLDVGGSSVSGFAPGAPDSYSEALAFPGTRIAVNGAIDPEWESFIANNVRVPGPVLNDIRSMIAANNSGQRRLETLLTDIGIERFWTLNQECKNLSERGMRAIIAALPDGTYDSMDWVEYDARGEEQLHEVQSRVIVDGDEMTIQFRGGPQTNAYINGAAPGMIGQAWSTILAQLAFDIPVNAGLWRPVHFDLGPKGTMVNSIAPAPVTMSHIQTGCRANRMLGDAFSQACSLSTDPRVASRVAGSAEHATFFTAFGMNRDTGYPVVTFPSSVSSSQGGPGQTSADGMEVYGITAMAGCEVPDVEVEEFSQPGMILWRRVAPDTGGAGTNRGGNGVATCIAILDCDTMNGGVYSNTAYVPPRGAAGGACGSAGKWEILRDTNLLDVLRSGRYPTEDLVTGHTIPSTAQNASMSIKRGDIYTIVHGGGGGVGDPLLRDPQRVVSDVRDGYTTSRAAQQLYGVALDDGGRLDAKATALARAEIRRKRIGAEPIRAVQNEWAAFAPVGVRGLRWVCQLCSQDLGPTSSNWREGAVLRETEVSEHMADRNQYAREHVQGKHVVVRENHCSGCASTLAVDVTLEDYPMVAASRFGIHEPFAPAL